MERDIIHWSLEKGKPSLYTWIDNHKANMVSFSVTRFEKNGDILIAVAAIAVVDL